ncbi:unnamed protein product, partial [Prorocentrum cordatum]
EARRADGTAEPARAPRGHPRGALRCGGSLSRRCRQSDAAAHRARPGGPVPRGGGGAGAVPSEGTAGRGGPGERRGKRERERERNNKKKNGSRRRSRPRRPCVWTGAFRYSRGDYSQMAWIRHRVSTIKHINSGMCFGEDCQQALCR